MKHMLQPEIDHLLSYARRDMQGPLGDAAANKEGWKIYRQMEPIVPAPDTSEYRSIWICAMRGAADNWQSFKDWKDEEACYGDGSPLTRDAWHDEWKSWYPHEKRWHLVSCAREKDWLSISIDHECTLSIEPGHVLDYPDKQRTAEFEKLWHVLGSTMDNLRTGSYKSLVMAELPYSCRWGFLRRSTFWRIAGVDGRRFGGDLPPRAARAACAHSQKAARRKPDVPPSGAQCGRVLLCPQGGLPRSRAQGRWCLLRLCCFGSTCPVLPNRRCPGYRNPRDRPGLPCSFPRFHAVRPLLQPHIRGDCWQRLFTRVSLARSRQRGPLVPAYERFPQLARFRDGAHVGEAE